jgi:ribosomal protein S18 acetylase RimI-like enzyme
VAIAASVAHLSRAAPDAPGLRPYVDALATAEDSRRCGVAAALLAAAREAAGAGWYTHLALETEVENAAARALYRSAGFEETTFCPRSSRAWGVCLECPIAGR